MLDSFSVSYKLTAKRARIFQVSTIIATIAIFAYNFITTCSPSLSLTYSQDCSKTLLPAGSTFNYKWFKMTSGVQLDYDGFIPQNCSLKNVVIRQWFTAMPIYMADMDIDCDQGVSLSVFDLTTSFRDQHFEDFKATAAFFRNYPKGVGPFEALGFKYNMPAYPVQAILLFNGTSITESLDTSDKDPQQNLYFETMRLALEEVQDNTLPGVRYQCSQCSRNADWTGQMGSLLWKLFYNTANTVGSAIGIILFAITLGMKNDLMELLRRQQMSKGTDYLHVALL
ncbi:hypothetical protein BC939DRAFT_445269 [Gamsiella multidivaricata]|uniref:uncharacterized protein n=1 Tax=Gamsiella multidivaricata TaxID=101098 RepID=UPI002220A596|nr:uncharacterized protein BC939DRAFT_445269 [Gamsiella multidivaricata]KAI7827444.1 hypothetical protein BC939DRAFT_445269 [Gamsiella multidivaricata]